MENIRKILFVTLAALALSSGCSNSPEHVPSQEESESVGSLRLALQLDPATTVSTVHYEVTGNSGYSESGEIDVTGSSTLYKVIPQVPVGEYTVVLTAVAVGGAATCSGTASFHVSAHQTTSVTVRLQCRLAHRTGTVVINGKLNVCPSIDGLVAGPNTILVGGTSALISIASDVDEGPEALSYSWSATSGTFSSSSAPSPTFTATVPGTATLTLTVSDGDCTDSWSLDVHVGAATPPDDDPPPDDDVADDDSTSDDDVPADDDAPVEARRPNILLIIADDLGAESTSLYPHLAGNSGQVPIPNIEALAENGLVFENAWASPMCSPTRSTIISGLYGYRTGVTTAGNTLSTSTSTVFDRITAESAAAYGQAFFGKYHLSGNNGATNLQHVRDLGIPIFRGYLGHTLSPPYNWTAVDINGPSVLIPQWAGTALTDFTIDYINNHESTQANDPWFVWLAHNASHESSNYVPPPQLHSVNLGNLQQGQLSNTVSNYKAITQSLDTEIGRLLAEVDLAKTTVIFIGDNGTPSGVKDSGSRVRGSKTSVYQGGVHVPLIIAGAGVTRRGREDALVTSTDLYATILSLAGLPVSQVNNSYSLTPLLTDENATTGRTHSFTEISTGATGSRRYAVRDQRYKLIYNVGTRELYDLVNDPLETTNLFNNSAYAEARASLEAEVATHRAIAPTYFP